MASWSACFLWQTESYRLLKAGMLGGSPAYSRCARENQRMASIMVTLNTEELETQIELWRATVDMKIPIPDHLKLHFIAKRREILAGLLETGRHYDALLALMEPVEADKERFAESRRKVQDFRRWAADGLHDLNESAKS